MNGVSCQMTSFLQGENMDDKQKVLKTVKVAIVVLIITLTAIFSIAWLSRETGTVGTHLWVIIDIHKQPTFQTSEYYLFVDDNKVATTYDNTSSLGDPYTNVWFDNVVIKANVVHTIWIEDSTGLVSDTQNVTFGMGDASLEIDLGNISMVPIDISLEDASPLLSTATLTIDGALVNEHPTYESDEVIQYHFYLEIGQTYSITATVGTLSKTKNITVEEHMGNIWFLLD
jgi:hypothetical protein